MEQGSYSRPKKKKKSELLQGHFPLGDDKDLK